MYKKVSDNKILKIKNNKITKIILSIEPFCIEEINIDKPERNNISCFKTYNEDKYDIEKLETITEEDIIKLFKDYINSSYNMEIQKKKNIIESNNEKLKILKSLDIEFEKYAYGNIDYERNIYAVFKDGKWYDYNHEFELNSTFKEGIVEEEFKACTKEEFLEVYIAEKELPIEERIEKINKSIIELKRRNIRVLNTNFNFILGE